LALACALPQPSVPTLCFTSAKCASSISAKSLVHRAHAVCGCIPVSILDPKYAKFLDLRTFINSKIITILEIDGETELVLHMKLIIYVIKIPNFVVSKRSVTI
jgi:hypothetical protein